MFKKHGGFSLVEVVVAAVIFSIAVVGIFSVFAISRRSSDASERSLLAAYLGRQILEDLRAKVDSRIWDTGAGGSWDTPGDPITCPQLETDLPPALIPNHPLMAELITNFNGQVWYTCDEDTSGTRKITLRISWDEP